MFTAFGNIVLKKVWFLLLIGYAEYSRLVWWCRVYTCALSILTGYNQSVTGCGSQRRHVVLTQRKLM